MIARPAKRLIRRTKPAKRILGDRAYDSAKLRQWLSDRGTRTVVPNKSNRKQPFRFDRKSYKQRHLSRMPSAASRTSAASPHAMTGSPETSLLLSDLPPESWTALSWKILIYHPWPDEGIFHEEVEVYGEPDRIHSAAG